VAGPPEDQYQRAWDRVGDHRTEIDDRPEWERNPPSAPPTTVEPRCCLCYGTSPLDEFNECERCRVAGGWCRWCSVDRIAYTTQACCRSCYRWLRRNQDRYQPDDLAERLRTVVARRKVRARR
jgi:hypothetical protein